MKDYLSGLRGISINQIKKYFFPGLLLLIGIVVLWNNNVTIAGEQHFVYLARSFLDGQLFFTHQPGYWGDTSLFNGHYYWPLGPLPAIIMMPFVAVLGLAMQQGYLLLVFNLFNLFLLYKIAHIITKRADISLWLSVAYVFSTAYLYVALKAWSWYFAQVIATSFVLLAIHEYFYKKRWWLIGIYLGLGMTTRVNIVLASLFFGLSILLDNEHIKNKLYKIFQLTLPVILFGFALLLYNYLRFHHIFEFGYRYQLLYHEPAINREYGLWSFIHFPANLYYFLFKGPEGVFLSGTKILVYPFLKPDIWGMSILFTSPILLWGFRASWKKREVWLSILTSALMLFVLLGYYGIGVRQYGYRYALDFYPFLFIMLAYAQQERLSWLFRIIVILSFLFNWYLIGFV
jgi:hypothetical protein